MRFGINWAGGGLPTLTKVVDGVPGAFPNPAYGQLQGLGISAFVLLVILGVIGLGLDMLFRFVNRRLFHWADTGKR